MCTVLFTIDPLYMSGVAIGCARLNTRGPAEPNLESGWPSSILVQKPGRIRLVTMKTAHDHTDTVERYTVRKLEESASKGCAVLC